MFENNKNKPVVEVPVNIGLPEGSNRIRDYIYIVLSFFVIYYLFYLLEDPVFSFIKEFMEPRSEYSVQEQLSKYYLFIVLLISIFSYWVLRESTQVKLSISFFLFSLVLYLSESNMITEGVQPLFGLLGVAFISYFLLRLRLWFSIFLFASGIVLISLGSLVDLTHENQSINAVMPEFVFYFLGLAHEERFDLLGIAFICLSVIVCFRSAIQHYLTNNLIAIALILLFSGMITVGNGFIHHQYGPGNALYTISLLTIVIGFVGITFSINKINKVKPNFMLITEGLFYIFLFLFFVVLPGIYGNERPATALLLWFPSCVFMAIYLWRQHSTYYSSIEAPVIEQ